MRSLTLGVNVAGRPSLHCGKNESMPASLKSPTISRTRSSDLDSLAMSETFWPWWDAKATVARRQVTMSLAPTHDLLQPLCLFFAEFPNSHRGSLLSSP